MEDRGCSDLIPEKVGNQPEEEVDEEDTDLVLKLRPEVKRCVEQELNEQLQYARRHLDLLLEECRCIAL